MKLLRTLLLVLCASFTYAQTTSYYLSAEGKSGSALRSELNGIISGNTAIPYSSTSNTDTWDVLKLSDANSSDPTDVNLIYSGASSNGAQEWNNGTGWTREHVWPQSLGGFSTSNGVGTDVHNLKPAIPSLNSLRSNLEYDFLGTAGNAVNYNGAATGCRYDGSLGVFEPRNDIKGDLARIILYMDLRYEGVGNDPDLSVQENLNSGGTTFGVLSTLLQWHQNDPVDAFESNRNEVIYNYQGNRNPFVDHPELAAHLYGSSTGISWNPSSTGSSTGGACGDLFFSEYGEGSSNNKYLELYNPTDSAISLAGYTLYLSGNGGSYTNTFTSTAVIDSNAVYVITNTSASATILAEADTAMPYPSVAHFNGDDAVILVNGTDTIDVIGVPGVDPGSDWPVGSGSTANNTLVRMIAIDQGSTDWSTGAAEWDVYSSNDWTFLGSHGSACHGAVPPPPTSFTATFRVNTANITVGPNGMYAGGGVLGGANALALTDIGGGIWEGSALLNGSNGGNFAFFNSPAHGSDWGTKEDISGLACADPANYNDRILPSFTQDTTLLFCFATCSIDGTCPAPPATYDVTFKVDMNDYAYSYGTVYVSGDFNGWSGTANPLADADNDGVWTGTYPIGSDSIEFKYTLDDWDTDEGLTPGSSCTKTTNGYTNRFVAITGTTDLAKVCWESCSACPSAPAPTTPCSNLYFSEYGEGSSSNKYLEIYNSSNAPVSLSGYTVYLSGNGGSYTNTFTSSAVIDSNGVFVIANSSADTSVIALSDTTLSYPSIVHFNGDDAVILVHGTDTIDVIGVPGVDPGTDWAVGSGSTANNTLVRMIGITGGSTDWSVGAAQWDVYASNDWTYIGSHSSSCHGATPPPPTSFTVTFRVNTANITVGPNGMYAG
ncbi:MAG: hypothetical protein CMP53_07060, partial [Flavobacteriales bacterium]|nr:hypothetical protein [Flavobacteriales bacterium]